MTSSAAPPSAPASRPLRFVDAARLHARRFHTHPIAAALRLLSADQRITHPDGGIALLTETGHTIRWTVAFLATFIPAVTAMVVGLATANVATTAIGMTTAVASALMLAPRCERQIRARRTFDTTDHPCVLSDVATEPHQRIGDQLMSQIGIRADEAGVDVVLAVRASNRTARTLYMRHGFRETHERGGKIAMQRLASPLRR